MPESVTITESNLDICPECEQSFDNIGNHWARGSCDFPALVDEQHEVVAGLLLGGAVLQTNYANPLLVATIRHRETALWTADQLGWLTSSVQRVPTQSDDEDGHTYKVYTRAHPGLERYTQWFGGGGKSPPVSSMRLSRRAVRIWYAYSASVAWSTSHDSRETLFSAKGDERREWVGALLGRLGYDPSYRHHGWYLSLSDTQDLLEWCGGPVAGVEHKWDFRKASYEDTRREQEGERVRPPEPIEIAFYAPGEYAPIEDKIPPYVSGRELHTQFSDSDCLLAIIATSARARAEIHELTIEEFEHVRKQFDDMPGSSLIADRFGGWSVAKNTAILESPRFSNHPRLSEGAAKLALRNVSRRTDDDLTKKLYDRVRPDHYPNADTISRNFGWNALKDELGIGVQYRDRTSIVEKSDAVSALLEVNDRVGGPLTMGGYDKNKDPDQPSSSAIASNYGWNKLKGRLGLEKTPYRVEKSDAKVALVEVSAHVDGTMSTETYEKYRDEHHPSSSTIAHRFGWRALKDEVGLE